MLYYGTNSNYHTHKKTDKKRKELLFQYPYRIYPLRKDKPRKRI